METMHIVPIGACDLKFLRVIADTLTDTFRFTVRIEPGISLPRGVYNAQRKQYHSSGLLDVLRRMKKGKARVLGVTDVDLYVPGLNFVFGEADSQTGMAVISMSRLREEFYGHPPNTELLYARTIKEAIHEIGHTYGLDHCPHRLCIMHFSNSLQDTDAKGPGFCTFCKKRLGLYELPELLIDR